MIQCGSFQRRDASEQELAKSLLDQLSNTRKALLPDHHFDSKYECNYAFNWGVSLKSADGGSFREHNYFYQNEFKFNFLESSVRDQISNNIIVNLSDTNTNGDRFFVEVYYISDRNTICSDELKKNENSRNFLSNLEDAQKLAVSLLDDMYHTSKISLPAMHLDAKYECNYVFELGLAINRNTEDAQVRVDDFYLKNLELYRIESESSTLKNIPANNKLLVEKENLADIYTVSIYYIDDSNILCSDKQELQKKDKSFDRNEVQKLAFSLSDSIVESGGAANYPSTHFEEKYDCNYVFSYDIALYHPELKNINKAFYQKNQNFYQSDILSYRFLNEISPDNQVKSVVLVNSATYTATIYFLDNPRILCP